MKTVLLSGKLTKGVLTYRPLRDEFQTNDWYLKVLSIGLSTQINEEWNEIITISSNFVTAEKYSDTEQLITYEQPLQLFSVKLTATNKKASFRFTDDLKYKVNSASTLLAINFSSETGTLKKDISARAVIAIGRFSV